MKDRRPKGADVAPNAYDLNLLTALDVLLGEGSVAAAAARMGLSPSAMSRTLERVRDVMGDPILVRAGGKLVPTPRALELRGRVHTLVEEARCLLRARASLDLGALERTFLIRANDGFVAACGPRIHARVVRDAPRARLQFVPKSVKDAAALREARIDLDVGVLGETGPEIRVQTLFRDRFIGAVREGHPLARAEVTPTRYAAYPHVSVSRRGRAEGPIDRALEQIGVRREISVVVPSFPAALALARESDLVASVPEHQTEAARRGMHTFALPIATEPVVVSQMWHPRSDADPAHEWLRGCVREACTNPRMP